MQSSSEQPLVGEEHCVTTLITAAKETITRAACNDILEIFFKSVKRMLRFITIYCYENGGENILLLFCLILYGLLNFQRINFIFFFVD